MLAMALSSSHTASSMPIVNLQAYDIQLSVLRHHLRCGLRRPTCELTAWHRVLPKTLIVVEIMKRTPVFMDYHGS